MYAITPLFKIFFEKWGYYNISKMKT